MILLSNDKLACFQDMFRSFRCDIETIFAGLCYSFNYSATESIILPGKRYITEWYGTYRNETARLTALE